jgi:hypothetical protein
VAAGAGGDGGWLVLGTRLRLAEAATRKPVSVTAATLPTTLSGSVRRIATLLSRCNER